MLIGLQEVAKRLGIAYQTVFYNYIKTGKIKAIKLDGFYKVRTEDLDAFIKNREYKPKGKKNDKQNLYRNETTKS